MNFLLASLIPSPEHPFRDIPPDADAGGLRKLPNRVRTRFF